MRRILNLMFHIIFRPFFIIAYLVYFIILLGLFVIFSAGIFLNIFTLVLIPVTAAVIYFLWNIYFNNNLNDQMFDSEVRKKYFNIINRSDRETIEKLMKSREDIQKIIKRTKINPSKQSLIAKIHSLDYNDLIEKSAANSIKIKFIDDFLIKKANNLKTIDDKIKKLKSAKAYYEKLNKDILHSFEELQAQAVLILADDVSAGIESEESIDEMMNKITTLEKTNNSINQFYVSIHKGEEYEI